MRRLEFSGSQGTSGLRKPFRPVQRGGGIKCSYFVLNLLTAFVKASRHLGRLLQCVIEWQHDEQKFEKGEGNQPLRT